MRALVVAVALIALASLPCAVALLVIAVDEYAELFTRAVRRGVRRWRSRLSAGRGFRWLAGRPPVEPVGPPIERIAADLRRLGQHRLSENGRSPIWITAMRRTYDDRLQRACRSLGVEEHLGDLDGFDLDIERVRVEVALSGAGMVLHAADRDPRPGVG